MPTSQVEEVQQIQTVNELYELKRNHEKIIVEFYADWCMPCRRFAATFKSLNNEYQEHIKFAKMEMSNHEEFGISEKIDVYPTFKFYAKGKELNKVIGINGDKLKDAVQKLLKEGSNGGEDNLCGIGSKLMF